MSKIVRTRAQWVEEICADYRRSVEAIIRMGRNLIAAKNTLPHGEFLEMIKADLPVTASTVQCLMKIATDAKLQKPRIAQHLPASWPTLYELTKAPEEVFDEAVTSGVINPKMTRRQAKEISGARLPSRGFITYDKPKTIIPVYLGTDGEAVERLRRLDELLRDQNLDWSKAIETVGAGLIREIIAGLTARADQHAKGRATSAAADRAEATASTRLQ
jgi:hypothetical protein